MALVVAGYWLRSRALRQNTNFTWHSFATVPNELIITGVYRYIRHPGYLGSLLVAVGLSLISIHLAFWLMVWSFLMDNAMDEENVMHLSRFGSSYDEYKTRTGMFIPKLRRRAKDFHVFGGLHPEDEVI